MGEFSLGLLAALPLLMFALCSPLAGRVARSRGMQQAVLGALVVLVLGIVLRSIGLVGLWCGTALVGASVAIANVLTPALVKRDFAKAALATAAFATALSGFAAIASGTAVPLADWLGGWRQALVAWVLLPAVVVPLWLWRTARFRDPTLPSANTDRIAVAEMWRSPVAWQVTVFFGLQSATFYTVVTWLPSIEHSFGVGAATAGVHLLVYQVLGSAGGLAIGALMQGREDQRFAAVAISLPVTIAMLGMAAAPQGDVVWVVIAAAGAGAALTVALTLVVLRTTTTEQTAALSGMAQSVGYLIAAVGPLGAGVIAALWGWNAVLLCTAGIALTQAVLGLWAGRGSPVFDDDPEAHRVQAG